jgi:L-seryl-tRNA(Ser) seleniumtransferase
MLARRLGDGFVVTIAACMSQIGSGSLPQQTIPSAGLAMRPRAERGAGRALDTLSRDLRGLGVPVIGRIEDGALVLDLRCLEDENGFVANLAGLSGGVDGLA